MSGMRGETPFWETVTQWVTVSVSWTLAREGARGAFVTNLVTMAAARRSGCGEFLSILYSEIFTKGCAEEIWLIG
jgi:hypothetical protein